MAFTRWTNVTIIPKILQKIDPAYRNYQPLIEHAIPIVFTTIDTMPLFKPKNTLFLFGLQTFEQWIKNP